MKDKTLLDEFAIMAMASIQTRYNSTEDWATAGYEHAKKIMRIRDKYLAEFLNEEYCRLEGKPLGENIAKEIKPDWLLKLESVAGVSQGYCENTVLPREARWVAVDFDGSLYCYQHEPVYYEEDGYWDTPITVTDYHKIYNINFPKIKPFTSRNCLAEIKQYE